MTEPHDAEPVDDEDLAELEDVIIDLRTVTVHAASSEVVTLHLARMMAAIESPE